MQSTIRNIMGAIWQSGYQNRLTSLAAESVPSLVSQFRAELYRRDLTAKFNAGLIEQEIETRRVIARYQRTAVSGIYLA